jgi:hypothetical protein
MDEILFDELPERNAALAINSDLAVDDDTDNLFWSEVTNRLSGNLKQAFAYLKDELKASKVETVFFISDHSKENILFELFRKNFRLANFRSLSNQFMFDTVKEPHEDDIEVIKDGSEDTKDKIHGSFMIANLGCYTMQYFSTPSYKNLVIETPLFNLHPKYSFIVNNFKLYDYFIKSRKWLIIVTLIMVTFLFYINLTNKNDVKNIDEFKQVNQDLVQQQNQLAFETKSQKETIEDFARLNNLKKGSYNEKLFNFFNVELPADLELERVVVRRNSFILLGNGKSVSEVNRFYRKFLSNPNFKDLIFKVYKRTNSNLNYFVIKGNTV